MHGFSKIEIKVIGLILAVIFTASFINFRISLRKARDAQRMSDLNQMAEFLNAYHKENSEFPLSLGDKLLIDPNSRQGRNYLFLTDGWTYQIFAALESSSEPEYIQAIVNRRLNCGNQICNAGRAFSKTPLDKTIEEYENEIRAKE